MSCDLFLGIPANIASYAILLHLLAKVTGYTPGSLTGFLADVHIYEDHMVQVEEQLKRTPGKLPRLILSKDISFRTPLEEIEPEYIQLEGYNPQPPISAPMAV